MPVGRNRLFLGLAAGRRGAPGSAAAVCPAPRVGKRRAESAHDPRGRRVNFARGGSVSVGRRISTRSSNSRRHTTYRRATDRAKRQVHPKCARCHRSRKRRVSRVSDVRRRTTRCPYGRRCLPVQLDCSTTPVDPPSWGCGRLYAITRAKQQTQASSIFYSAGPLFEPWWGTAKVYDLG